MRGKRVLGWSLRHRWWIAGLALSIAMVVVAICLAIDEGAGGVIGNGSAEILGLLAAVALAELFVQRHERKSEAQRRKDEDIRRQREEAAFNGMADSLNRVRSTASSAISLISGNLVDEPPVHDLVSMSQPEWVRKDLKRVLDLYRNKINGPGALSKFHREPDMGHWDWIWREVELTQSEADLALRMWNPVLVSYPQVMRRLHLLNQYVVGERSRWDRFQRLRVENRERRRTDLSADRSQLRESPYSQLAMLPDASFGNFVVLIRHLVAVVLQISRTIGDWDLSEATDDDFDPWFLSYRSDWPEVAIR